jgi:hypothetical protein
MNLDTLCAQCGYDIVRDVAPEGRLPKSHKSRLENTVTKALGVLHEDGVYAFFLFLDYFRGRSESLGADHVASRAKELLRAPDVSLLRTRQPGERDDFGALRDLTNNLDNLLLARQLLEQALIYARYHAKALSTT